jgi:predicted DCC family thiol-disulfide oxidoreductase YuxK
LADERRDCGRAGLCEGWASMSAPILPLTESGSLTCERYPLLVFFDGECVFCDRWINRVRDADHTHRIRFGTKQGRTFQEVKRVHPEVANVESIVLVARRPDGGEDFLVRSSAIREVLKGLPGFRFFESVLQVTPTPLVELGYRIFSKLRKPIFGRLSQCRVPLEEEKTLFVE